MSGPSCWHGEPDWPGADIAAVMMGLGNTCLMLLCCWCCTRTVRRRARAYRRTVPRAIRLASASSEEEQQSWLAPAQNVTSRRYIFRVNTLARPCLWDMLLRLHQSSRLPNHSRSQERSTGMSVIFLVSFLPLLLMQYAEPCEYLFILFTYETSRNGAQSCLSYPSLRGRSVFVFVFVSMYLCPCLCLCLTYCLYV